jgi:proteasome accessory factor B
VGHDRDRTAPRVFRLSRIVGPVKAIGAISTPMPDDVDLRSFIERAYRREPVDESSARIAVRPGAALQLRRWAAEVDDGADDVRGWDVAHISYGDLDWMAQGVAGHADDVVVLEPPELVDAVVRRLTAAAS